MALLERLAILITADAAGALNEMKKVADSAEKDLGKAGAAGSTLSANMTKVGAAMMGAGAGLLAVGISAASTTVDLGVQVMKLQRYTGMTAEESSKLAFAARMTGVNVDDLTTGLGKLSKTMETGNPAFAKLGVEARNSNGSLKSMAQFLPEIADKFKQMPDGAEKTALALQLLGRNGMSMVPLLNQGSEGIKAFYKEAEKMGLVLSQDNVDAIKKYRVSQRELSAAFDGLKVDIGNTIIPLLTDFTNIFKNIPTPVRDAAGEFVVFGGGLLLFGGTVLMVAGQIKKITTAFQELKIVQALSSEMSLPMIGGMVAVGIAAAVATSKLIGLNNASYASVGSVQDLTANLRDLSATGQVTDELSTKMERLGDASKHTSFWSNLISNTDGWKQALGVYGALTGQFYLTAGVLLDNKNRTDDATAAIGKLKTSISNLIESDGAPAASAALDYLEGRMIRNGASADEAARFYAPFRAQVAGSIAPIKTLAQAEADAAVATNNHVTAIKAVADALHAAMDPFFAAESAATAQVEAQRAQAKAMADVTKAQNDLNAARAGGDPKAVADAESALADAQSKADSATTALGRSSLDLEIAMKTLKAEVEQHPEKLQASIDKINSWAASGAITKEQAQQLAWQLGLVKIAAESIPPDVHTYVHADTWEAAQNIENLINRVQELNRLAHSPSAYNFGGQAMGGRIFPGAASGTRSGGPHLVGELGPEIFWPDSAGTIVTAERTKQMLSSSGGGNSAVYNINVNVAATADKASIGQTIVESIAAYERRSGDGWRAA